MRSTNRSTRTALAAFSITAVAVLGLVALVQAVACF